MIVDVILKHTNGAFQKSDHFYVKRRHYLRHFWCSDMIPYFTLDSCPNDYPHIYILVIDLELEAKYYKGGIEDVDDVEEPIH